jgi:ribosomal protein S20
MASGEIFKDISASVPKTTLKEAVIKDKNNNNSYLGAMWNNVVASAERLAGGAARLAQKFDTSPVSMIQESVDKAASSVTGINYEAQREKEIADKVKSFIGKARTSSSSREYEQGLAEGFDITNGIGLDDLKGLGAVLPSMLADIAIAAPTAGSSFAIQGYDDALSTLDNIPEAKYMSETTRTAFGFGGAIVAGVLEKLGMDNILKSGTVTKYVTSKILKETAGELAKKGVKVTAEQFEKAVANKATQMLTKTALKNTVKAGAKSALAEGATEATQEGAMDLMKLAANQLENSEIFDEEELKNTAASRYLNAAAMGGIFGGTVGSFSSRTKNVQQHIEDEVKNAKTQEDIDNIVNEINQSVQEGVISENDADIFKSMVDDNLSKPSSLDIENEKEVKLADIDSKIASLNKEDRLYNDNLSKLNKERNETISYYDNLSKQSQKDEETSFDDGKITPTEEIVTEEVTPTEVEVTEEVKPKIERPSAEQQAKESAEGNTVTFTYKTEAEVPEVFKDRITSYGENKIGLFGKKEKIVRVSVPKSLADYELNKLEQPKTETYPTEVKVTEKTNLEDEYNSKSVDELIELKKKLYPEPDIETPMTPEEKLLDRVIAKKFSEKNQEIIEKRKAAKEVKPTEVKVTENIESKKSDIEGERKAELENLKKGIPAMITKKLELGLKQYGFTDAQINKMTPIVANETLINAKYDAKLAALESGKAEVKPTKAKEAVEAPKPVKEVPKEKKAVQAYKDLTRNEKRQIINSKFDELIKVLKIEKICPT